MNNAHETGVTLQKQTLDEHLARFVLQSADFHCCWCRLILPCRAACPSTMRHAPGLNSLKLAKHVSSNGPCNNIGFQTLCHSQPWFDLNTNAVINAFYHLQKLTAAEHSWMLGSNIHIWFCGNILFSESILKQQRLAVENILIKMLRGWCRQKEMEKLA